MSWSNNWKRPGIFFKNLSKGSYTSEHDNQIYFTKDFFWDVQNKFSFDIILGPIYMINTYNVSCFAILLLLTIFFIYKKIILANMYTIRIIVNMFFFYPILLEIGIENVQFLTMKIIDILLQSMQNNIDIYVFRVNGKIRCSEFKSIQLTIKL